MCGRGGGGGGGGGGGYICCHSSRNVLCEWLQVSKYLVHIHSLLPLPRTLLLLPLHAPPLLVTNFWSIVIQEAEIFDFRI